MNILFTLGSLRFNGTQIQRAYREQCCADSSSCQLNISVDALIASESAVVPLTEIERVQKCLGLANSQFSEYDVGECINMSDWVKAGKYMKEQEVCTHVQAVYSLGNEFYDPRRERDVLVEISRRPGNLCVDCIIKQENATLSYSDELFYNPNDCTDVGSYWNGPALRLVEECVNYASELHPICIVKDKKLAVCSRGKEKIIRGDNVVEFDAEMFVGMAKDLDEELVESDYTFKYGISARKRMISDEATIVACDEDRLNGDFLNHKRNISNGSNGVAILERNKTIDYRNLVSNLDGVMGDDDRVQIHSSLLDNRPWSQIVILVLGNGGVSCTGVFIRDGVVVTNRHVCYNDASGEWTDIFGVLPSNYYDMYTSAGGWSSSSDSWRQQNGLFIRYGARRVLGNDVDLCFLTTKENPYLPTPAGMNWGAWTGWPGDYWINTAGYPNPPPSNGLYALYYNYCKKASVPASWRNVLYHHCDTTGGQSGSPMWYFNSNGYRVSLSTVFGSGDSRWYYFGANLAVRHRAWMVERLCDFYSRYLEPVC